jgi:tRNA G37 N-methylase Trm5
LKEGLKDTSETFSKFNHKVENVRIVREVGPRFYQVVSDVEII